MKDKDLEMLEFPKIREILAAFTSFSVSRDLALQLHPSSDYDLISLQLRRSAEARRLLALQPDFSIRGACDVREIAPMAARGKILEPLVLVDVQRTLAAARYVRTTLRKVAQEFPELWRIADRIVEMSYLEEEIGRSISSEGEVLDSASTWLADLRSKLKDMRQQLMDQLDWIMKSPLGQRCLQDDFITERGGRHVIPVKFECRMEIKGIVHDISNTGATAFVEPWAAVELGNELREIAAEEKREVERILAALSAEVGENEADLSHNVNLFAELDLAIAKARYAAKVKANEPRIGPPGGLTEDDSGKNVLRLIDARHPLLRGEAVPLTVEMGRDYSVLVITGPNAGGKTVALKTIGLLTLMAQAGMPIPASEKSFLPLFDNVCADIGDEQSIEETLSTFSWHMSNIVRILRSAEGRSLVLLDELGTSTDPNEGAALAQSILQYCLSRGNMVVATSHYSEVKVFAHTTPGMRNASLDFDPVTFAPNYHLTMGIAGGSNALAIASRLGLPSEIVDSARGRLSQTTRDTEALFAELHEEKRRIEGLRKDLERETAAAEEMKSHWETELRRLKEQEGSLLRETTKHLDEETSELQGEIRRAMTDLKKTRSKDKVEQAEKALRDMKAHMKTVSAQMKSTSQDEETGEAAKDSKMHVGDRVWLTDMRTWGIVLSLRDEGDQVEVQVGNTKLITSLWSLDGTKRPAREMPSKPSIVRHRGTRATSLELDLRGKRADDVAPELDRYINDAIMAQLSEVRIVHGFGTGTVRQIVREALASHPLVKSFRPGTKEEGGDGVTVVNL